MLLRQICLLVCELTIKGGWAGVNIAPASEAPERARRAPDARRCYGVGVLGRRGVSYLFWCSFLSDTYPDVSDTYPDVS